MSRLISAANGTRHQYPAMQRFESIPVRFLQRNGFAKLSLWHTRYTTLVISTPMFNGRTLNVIPVTSRTLNGSPSPESKETQPHVLSPENFRPLLQPSPDIRDVSRGSARTK